MMAAGGAHARKAARADSSVRIGLGFGTKVPIPGINRDFWPNLGSILPIEDLRTNLRVRSQTAYARRVSVALSRVFDYARTERRTVLVLIAGILVAVLAALALGGGTPVRIAAATCLIAAPLAAYLALEHPVVFPYGLYVLLMPYDVLLVVHGNSTLTKVLGEAAGIFCLFYCLRVRHVAPVRRPLGILVLLLLWMSLVTLWSIQPQESLAWLQSYFGLALLYAALALTPVPLRDFRIVLVLVGISFSVAAIFGIHAFYHDGAFAAAGDLEDRRISLKLGNSEIDQNHFANAFLFPIAVLITGLLRSRWLSIKGLCAIGIGLMVTAMLVSGSREAFIALAAMVLYFLWRGRERAQLVALSAVCAIFAAPFAGVVIGRFANAFASGSQGRASIWAVGWQAIQHYWIAGSGLGTFPDVYDRFYLAVAQIHPDGWARPPHDLLIHYTVELGIVGIGLIVWFYAAHFTMLRGIDRSHPFYDYRVMVEAALVGIAIVSCFIDLFTYKYAWLVFASAAQVAYLATTVRRNAPESVAGDASDVGQREHLPVERPDRVNRRKVPVVEGVGG